MSVVEIDKRFVANTYNRFPLEIAYGKGSVVTDVNGKNYIDMGSGIGVTAFGFCDEEWKQSVIGQLDLLQHTSNLYYTAPCAILAEKLCEKSGMKKVFFGNSGAEANECAIKTARKYAKEKKGKEYYNIITLKNSFHGRTVTTLAATGQDVFHSEFQPLTDGFLYADANDLEGLSALVENNKVAGIMIECVQGEGGVLPLVEDFVKGIAEIAAEKDIVFIVDEVQTGNGRTGKYFSYMHYGVSPDIVTTAKGLGGGLPIGACLFGEKTQNVLNAGDHGSTFGGNPVACAGAISVVDRIDENLLSDVREKSEYAFNVLREKKGIKGISGKGLMIGVETEKDCKKVVAECIDKGALFLTAKTKVRMLPALNIPFEEFKKALDILIEVCAN